MNYMRCRGWLLWLWCSLLIVAPAQAGILDQWLPQSTVRFLTADEAFQATLSQDQGMTIKLTMADGYYIYQSSLKVTGDATLGALPPGVEHEDDFFGKTTVYYDGVSLPVQPTQAQGKLTVTYQGCTEGLCYPPVTVPLSFQRASVAAVASPIPHQAWDALGIAAQLSEPQPLWRLGIFLLLGVGLAFTPCVFPMYPILTSIIAGVGQISTARRTVLCLAYVQGMALTYSALGLVVASVGLQFQAALQHPVVLSVLMGLLLILAGSLFGCYTIQLPSRWQTRLNQYAQRQQGGSMLGVTLMGMISGLVCSPCTTAPLSGILLYVAQSGDLWWGGLTLYVLSLGMGLPLLMIGIWGGKYLPQAGVWMERVKECFGFGLVAVALLFFERMVSAPWSEVAWTIFAVAVLSYAQYHVVTLNRLGQALGQILIILLLAGVVWQGVQRWGDAPSGQSAAHALTFTPVSSEAEFAQQLTQNKGRWVLVDIYASWCVACKDFETQTFTNSDVQAVLKDVALLQWDVTANTPEHQAFLQRYQVLGLPTLLVIDPQGQEQTTGRITGFMSTSVFLQHWQKVTQR